MCVDCSTCKFLWDELAEATKADVAILGKYRLAQIVQNSALLTEMESLTLAATQRRSKARIAFKDHEASHQNEGAKTQTA